MLCAALHSPAERQQRFLKLWTLKEAYLKAVGRGISGSPGLAGFTVDPRPARRTSVTHDSVANSAWPMTSSVHAAHTAALAQPDEGLRVARAAEHLLQEEVHFVPPEGVSADEWRFALMQPTAQHVAAVCVRVHDRTEQCQAGRMLNICARETLPLMWDRELETSIGGGSPRGMMISSKL